MGKKSKDSKKEKDKKKEKELSEEANEERKESKEKDLELKQEVDKSGKSESSGADDKSNDSVSKLIIGIEDEITFLLDKLENSPSKKVIVSIPSGSDLLVSSISMKLISEKADSLDKKVIIVTDDTTGKRVAGIAGLLVKGSMNEVDNDSWGEAEELKRLSNIQLESKVREESKLGLDGEVKDQTDDDKKMGKDVDKKNISEVSEDRKDQNSGMVSSLAGGAVTPDVSKARSVSPSDVSTVSDGDFEMTVHSGVSKSASTSIPSSETQGRSAADVSIKDTADTSAKSIEKKPLSKPKGLVGRDFSSYEPVGYKADTSKDELPVPGKQKEYSKPDEKSESIGAKLGKIYRTSFLARIVAFLAAKKVATLILPLLLILVIIGAFMIWFMPEVFVQIDVESVSVDFTGDVTALTSSDDVDEEDLVIPARQEEILKNGSDNASATGTATRGEKATGTVKIINTTTSPVNVAAGTQLVYSGKVFILDGDVSIAAATPSGDAESDGTVTASEVGSDYNVGTGEDFVVGAFESDKVYAISVGAFSGGSEESYDVVSQSDIDKLAKKIKKDLEEEAKDEFDRMHQDSRWVFVESSMKTEIDGDVESDVPAGTEQDSVNVDLKTKSTALFYDGDALNSLIEDLLLKDVDGNNDMEGLQLSGNIKKEISVRSASISEGKVILAADVSGYVMPELDEAKIENGLQGRGWADGIAYLKKLDYVSGDPEVDFYPQWFPKFLWRMPSRDGRITVKIENVEPEDDGNNDNNADSDSENSDSVAE